MTSCWNSCCARFDAFAPYFGWGALDTKVFRRKLRKVAPAARFALGDGETLHRSTATKKLFLEAQHFAELSGQIVYPVHLLLAALFTQDQYSDEVMDEMGIDKKHLQEITKGKSSPRSPPDFRSAVEPSEEETESCFDGALTGQLLATSGDTDCPNTELPAWGIRQTMPAGRVIAIGSRSNKSTHVNSRNLAPLL